MWLGDRALAQDGQGSEFSTSTEKRENSEKCHSRGSTTQCHSTCRTYCDVPSLASNPGMTPQPRWALEAPRAEHLPQAEAALGSGRGSRACSLAAHPSVGSGSKA